MGSDTPRTATTEWKWRRREAIIRDDYECQECGAKGGPEGDADLEVHHVEPASEGGSDDLENLTTLCKDCHRSRVHSAPRGAGEPVHIDESGRVHDAAGRFTDKYPPGDLVDAIEALGGAAATSEVADHLEASRNTIYKKLREMEERGEVDSRLAGGIRVWSVANGHPDGRDWSREP